MYPKVKAWGCNDEPGTAMNESRTKAESPLRHHKIIKGQLKAGPFYFDVIFGTRTAAAQATPCQLPALAGLKHLPMTQKPANEIAVASTVV